MYRLCKSILTFVLFVFSLQSGATGMVPDTSLLWITDKNMGGELNVRNSDSTAALLYTKIVDVENDKTLKVLVTQPVVRVEGGAYQKLRFVLQTDRPLTTEHYKRLIIENIPPKSNKPNQVNINVRQDLPVIIHPDSLPIEKEPWKLLQLSKTESGFLINNPSKYVVRLNQKANVTSAKSEVILPKTYILPGEKVTVTPKSGLGNGSGLTIYPVSRYGVPVGEYQMKVGYE
ncbi:fimbria/pilus periplasmic chaperone [Salmonella enterica]|nr:fimbrial chaperone protein [Salmonella enterica]EGW2852197.1 fimbria/pilus periplasmic chaperone [Salmonella enterica]